MVKVLGRFLMAGWLTGWLIGWLAGWLADENWLLVFKSFKVCYRVKLAAFGYFE